MQKLDIFKTVLDAAVSSGVGSIVGNHIKASTPADANKLTKATTIVGGLVLSGAAGSWATGYARGQVDQTAAQLQALRGAVKAAKQDKD